MLCCSAELSWLQFRLSRRSRFLRQVRGCIVCKCSLSSWCVPQTCGMPLLATGHWLLATATATGNWQLVNDYQFVINGQADRCWPRPKMCICDRHNKSVESGNGGVAQSERGREVGRAGGKLAKNGSKCWHCRRPLVDANRV